MWWWRLAPLAAMAALGVVEPSLADTPGQWTNCMGGAGISRELQIAGCTAVIGSRHPAKERLPVAYYNRGHAYAEKSQWGRALGDFDRALQLKPNYAEALVGRGEAYTEKSKWRHAIRDYDRAIRLTPDFADAYEDRAIAHDTLHEYDRAIADFDQALRLKPNDAALYYLRGSTKLEKDDPSGHDDIARAKELNPKLPMGTPKP